MLNFDSHAAQIGQWRNRFPEGVEGISLWRAFSIDITAEFPKLKRPPSQLRIPRVFVSYKSQDRNYALRIAYLCNDEGFYYWLDVLDPNLSNVKNQLSALTVQQKSFAVAAIIEMALLNSSHVIASITPLTWNSRWVPYEFGRVKDSFVLTSQASSWIAPNQNKLLPEYLHLCPRSFSEIDICRWLSNERNDWERKNRIKLMRPASQWTFSIPPRLP